MYTGARHTGTDRVLVRSLIYAARNAVRATRDPHSVRAPGASRAAPRLRQQIAPVLLQRVSARQAKRMAVERGGRSTAQRGRKDDEDEDEDEDEEEGEKKRHARGRARESCHAREHVDRRNERNAGKVVADLRHNVEDPERRQSARDVQHLVYSRHAVRCAPRRVHRRERRGKARPQRERHSRDAAVPRSAAVSAIATSLRVRVRDAAVSAAVGFVVASIARAVHGVHVVLSAYATLISVFNASIAPVATTPSVAFVASVASIE